MGSREALIGINFMLDVFKIDQGPTTTYVNWPC